MEDRKCVVTVVMAGVLIGRLAWVWLVVRLIGSHITHTRHTVNEKSDWIKWIKDSFASRRAPSKKHGVVGTTPKSPEKVSEANLKKVFVGGIMPSTAREVVQAALLKLGPIKRLDYLQKRGFAVVLFENPAITEEAISTGWLDIDGKRVGLLPFVPQSEHERSKQLLSSSLSSLISNTNGSTASLPVLTPPVDPSNLRKVYVGGITPMMNEEIIKSSISIFGSMESVTVNPIKGYALVTFKAVEAANEAVKQYWITIGNKKVELVVFKANAKKERKSKEKSETM